jgi:site-specific recombinase XerD
MAKSTSPDRTSSLYVLITEYTNERIALGQISHSSAEVIRCVLGNLARTIDGDLDRLRGSAVKAWIAEASLQPATVKSRLTKAGPFVRWLVAEGHLESDVTAGIPIPRLPKRIPRALPAEAVARILAVAPDARGRLVVLLMAQMGLRVGEVAAIRVGDVDDRRRVLAVRGKGGRGEVTRAVPFTGEAWEALEAYREEAGRQFSGHLIVSWNAATPGEGVSAAYLGRLTRRWFSAAGVKVYAYDGMSAHALRHTCAQDVADAGADIRHVQELLGHASLRTTQDYLRISPPGLREAMEGRRYADPDLVTEPAPRTYECEDCGRAFRFAANRARHRSASHA